MVQLVGLRHQTDSNHPPHSCIIDSHLERTRTLLLQDKHMPRAKEALWVGMHVYVWYVGTNTGILENEKLRGDLLPLVFNDKID